MKTKAEHSIIADAIHEWHTVYLPCIRNLSHNALKSYGEGMGIYIDLNPRRESHQIPFVGNASVRTGLKNGLHG